MLGRLSFPIQDIQIDNGSEFHPHFFTTLLTRVSAMSSQPRTTRLQ